MANVMGNLLLMLSACQAASDNVVRVAIGWSTVIEGPAMEKFIDAHPEKLVMAGFFAPWCGHCKEFKPRWEQVAGTLLGDEEADMEIYTVDATLATSADVVSKYGIEQYPSIRLIKGENMMKYEILNPDDMTEDSLLKWVKETVEIEKRPPPEVAELHADDVSIDTINVIAEAHKITVLCAFTDDDWPRSNLTTLAEYYPENKIVAIVGMGDFMKKHYDIEASGAVMIKQHDYDVDQIIYPTKLENGETDWSTQSLSKFVAQRGPPSIRNYDRKTGRTILNIAGDTGVSVMIFAAPNNVVQCQETLTYVAREYLPYSRPDDKYEAIFVLFDPELVKENYGIYKWFGIAEDAALPTILIVDSKNNTDADGTHRNSKIYKVPMPGKLCHAGSTREALELYFSGNTNELHETFDHIADSAVRTMTNETWKAAVQEADLFLLELYAPWCGHCKTLEPQYDAAAVSIREAGYDRTSVVLAKLDASTDSSILEKFGAEGFPTLVLFRTRDPDDFSLYKGERSQEAIADFMHAEVKSFTKLQNGIPEKTAKSKKTVKSSSARKKSKSQKVLPTGAEPAAAAPKTAESNAADPITASVGSRGEREDEGIASFLDRINLSKYRTLFEEEEIDIEALKLFQTEDFTDLGIKLGARVKILNALNGGSHRKDEL